MDIAAYINDLLEQHEVVSVPELGSFYRSQVDGYYSKEQNLFYPPSIQIQFDPQFSDDDTLARLVAADRHLSPPSARYFIERFVEGVKEQAAKEDVTFGNLGTFNTRGDELTFEANQSVHNSELFYGLAPVELKRGNNYRQQEDVKYNQEEPPFLQETHLPPPIPVEEPISEEPAEHALYTPQLEMSTIAPSPFLPYEEEQPQVEETAGTEEEETIRRGVNIWTIVALTIILIAAVIIGLYKYKPALFAGFKKAVHKEQPKPNAIVAPLSVADSIKQDSVARKDIGIAQPVADSVKAPADTFALVVASFKTYKKAQQQLQIYTDDGLTPQIKVAPTKGHHFQINVGAYTNRDTALVQLKNIRKKIKTPIIIQFYPSIK